MTQAHILVVDDDTRLRHLLHKYLSENGFQVAEASLPDEADELLTLFQFDVIIMDVMMPHKNGQDFTKELRERGITTPIFMLTAMGDIDNRITGLEAGADDYLSKPFEPRELILRLKNLLKRQASEQEETDIYFGSCIYQTKAGILLKDGQPISLTTAEQALLKIFVSRPREIVSREELGHLIDTDNLRTVDVQITRLRKKIEDDIKMPLCIQTVRGQGYTLITK